MKVKMTPTLWEFVRELLGLPGETKFFSIPSEELAHHFLNAEKAGDCAPGQRQKEVRAC